MSSSSRPLYTLGPRLAACAALVRPGRSLVDVGTDHAYLPIWLLKTGKIPRATACDINAGPLEAARRHARLYQAEEGLRLVRGDGLRELGPEDGEDIVAAGMGGELILRIVCETPWLRNREKRLVLQPMSAAVVLRQGLWEQGFQVLEERAVEDGGKVYSAFSAQYIEEPPPVGRLYPYMGKLEPEEPAARLYAAKVLRGLRNQLQGVEHQGCQQAAEELRELMREIGEKYSTPVER